MAEYDSINILEFDKIRSFLVGKCLTPAGKEHALSLVPFHNDTDLNRNLDETTEMAEILKFEEPFPLQRLDDTDTMLHQVSTEGTYLAAESLLKFKIFLETCGRLRRYVKNKEAKYPLLVSYLTDIKLAPDIINAIEMAIDKTGEIRDSASPELRRIRIEKGSTRSKVLSKLEGIIKSRRQIGTRQDDLITIRDGRYVIPVPETDLSSESGVVHDRSKSGATVFVEPMQTVELNNRLRKLDSDEEHEIERILMAIADMIRSDHSDLRNNYRIISIIDFIHSRGVLSTRLEANRPLIINENRIRLVNARHPLLLLKAEKRDEVIPMSLSLGGKFDALVVTGPNTGGKTVALKSLGLLVLMARSGLHIPADRESEIGSTHKVFADIGDEQSIELSLSTFSSHLSRIVKAVENCDNHSLILLDEIGAGTDPKEGSALGESILAHILNHGGLAFVTTHYSALKTLPEKYPRIENASLEFDNSTLKPTYRFTVGLPGSSYAIEIARRLGMPTDIVDQALSLTGTQERSLSSLLGKLESELRESRRERKVLSERMKKLEKREHRIKERESKLKEKADALEREQLDDGRELVEKTRKELERVVKEIRERQAHKDSVKKAHVKLDGIEERIENRQRKVRPPTKRKRETLSPGDMVWVETLQAEGELLEYTDGSGCWKVRVGNMISSVKSDYLAKVTSANGRPEIPSGVNYAPFEDISSQISVRGQTAEEAIESVDAFLDRASLGNLETVYILHGKGTGVLRRVIKNHLSKHRLVSDFRLGYVSEGSSGVTVVSLKRE